MSLKIWCGCCYTQLGETTFFVVSRILITIQKYSLSACVDNRKVVLKRMVGYFSK